jgi:cytochrome c biogenesis protein CcmG/thiol:disulfide interchange protein DsbE
MKIITLILFGLLAMISNTQEKKIWAKSFINQEAPKLIVENWISDKPEMSGKFVLIDFWATWCGPCKKAIPKLNSFHAEFKDELIVIGISNESDSRVRKQINPKIEYFSAIDTKSRLKKIYEVKGIPHCVLINPNGIVVWEGWPDLEGYELTSEVITELIENYNKQQNSKQSITPSK